MRIRFSAEATAKLRAIRAYIAQDSPARADAMIDRIMRRVQSLGEVPRAGRQVPEFQREDLREILERPYRIIYRLGPKQIEIVTVMHYRQLLPEDLR